MVVYEWTDFRGGTGKEFVGIDWPEVFEPRIPTADGNLVLTEAEKNKFA